MCETETDPLDDIRRRFSRNYPPAVYVGKGWVPIVTNLHAALVAADPELRYCIVAEKYGMLRVLLEHDTEQTRKLIRDAEELAMATCDQCGGAGSMHTRRGWLRTLCPTCAAETHYVPYRGDR